ncbi:anthranilate synthase component I [Propioniciclava sp. MC1595]|uniref:anthranilate synthase component I n=1 Tax=Propioniciclava sp. MC1595 TaxID=2760308 RepID=UPI0016622851|nr:anthranilate synthase component I [Propioniciclava sp. MC1595]MBB1495336.1 anthranilate synthase component I [Propioniciclava sp. MC1595]QTE24712.1 anthranilate synthase component I [Propioniciclava sp. MC1595]
MNAPVTPDLAGFRAQAAEQGRRVVSVHTRLFADDVTPVGLYHHLCGDRTNTFLFESAEQGVWARYSIIGVNAAAVLSESGGQATWSGRELANLPRGGDPLAVLAETLERLHTPRDEALPPMTSGMVGYLGYDIVRRLERLPDSNLDDLALPELVMMLAADVAVLDHHTGEVWLVANAINFDDSTERVDEAYADAVARLEAMVARLREPMQPLLSLRPDVDVEPDVTRQRTQEEFEAAVLEAVEDIKAGETFQVVVSQRFEVPCTADALDVYRVLRRSNPSPYMYLLRLDGLDVVGSSPEALVTVHDRHVLTHPIAGSQPRGATPEADAAHEAHLLADPKERAEHLMLVDLGRNDLGRVCVPGTVSVVEFMQVRRYSHIMHLESTVVGQLSPGRTALDATLSCFPAGTLSGAPKVRAMEIIDRLEASRRGLYGGVVGYFDFAGNSDVAIAIRTAVLKDGTAYVQAGGGIVADSVPASEDLESRNKAAAALRAVVAASGMRRVG